MKEQAKVEVVPCQTVKDGFHIQVDGRNHCSENMNPWCGSESEVNAKADYLRAEYADRARIAVGHAASGGGCPKCDYAYCQCPPAVHSKHSEPEPGQWMIDLADALVDSGWIHLAPNVSSSEWQNEARKEVVGIISQFSALAASPSPVRPPQEAFMYLLWQRYERCAININGYCFYHHRHCSALRQIALNLIGNPAWQEQEKVSEAFAAKYVRKFEKDEEGREINSDTFVKAAAEPAGQAAEECQCDDTSIRGRSDCPLHSHAPAAAQPEPQGARPNPEILKELELNALTYAAQKIAYAWERSREKGAQEVRILLEQALHNWLAAHTGDAK